MATSDLTNAQLHAAANTTVTIPQPDRKLNAWAGCKLHFYQADPYGAFPNKLVVEVDVGDGGATVLLACDDTTVFAGAEIAGIPTMLKRAVVEARAQRVAGK